MKHIGLFEGIGGFSLAGRWMGWETKAWCEWDEFCQKVLKHHFPNADAHGDITTTDFTRYAGQIDILTGGFPCQPYSSAGKRRGKEDDRHLWPEMLRAIREIQPRWVVGENVRGLTNWNGGLVFDEVQADLENEGYEVTPYLLPACAVNAPHRRDRIWFVAYHYEGSARPPGEGRSIEGKWGENDDEPEMWGEQAEQHIRRGEFLRNAANANGKGLSEWIQPGFGGVFEQERTFKGREPSRRNTAIDWGEFPTQSPICGRDDGISRRLDGITFSKWREKSIGAYGNAIVPQVAFQIFKAISNFG